MSQNQRHLLQFLCSDCKTTDEHKFARSRPDLCRECKKAQKPYNCKHCGDTNKENFKEGRYGICKKCRSIENSKLLLNKRRKDKFENLEFQNEVSGLYNSSETSFATNDDGSNKSENPELKALSLKAIELGVEKFLASNRKFMSGYTIQEILENFSAYNIHKSKEDLERDNEIEYLKDEISELKFLISEKIKF
jgi:hypothetical protein